MDNAMASDGWTMTPNDYLDHMSTLGNAELRVLLAITRKTIGYQKDTDVISFSQFEEITGLARQHVKAAIDSLLSKGIISRTDAKRSSFSYRLVTLGNQSPKVTSNEGLPEPVTLGNQSLVTLGSTQNKEKEISKERDSRPVSSDTKPPPTEAPKAKAKTPPNRNPKVKAAAPTAPSDHRRLMQEYADILGYALPNGGKEAAGAALLLKAGYTVEQVVSVYCEMKADKFWASKHLSLHNVHQQIGAILNQQQARQRAALERTNGLNGHHHHVAEPEDEGQYVSREELLATRGGGGK